MTHPVLSDFGLSQRDTNKVAKYDLILEKRKEFKELLAHKPVQLLTTIFFVGLIGFAVVFYILGLKELKAALVAGVALACFYVLKSLLIYIHMKPPLYSIHKDALNKYNKKVSEYCEFIEEKKRTDTAKILIEKHEARKVAERIAEAAENEKRNARKSLEFWQELDGIAFENEFASLLKDSGYKDIRLTATTGDEGIDLWGTDLDGYTCIFQCKAYKDPVVPSQVRELLGALASVKDKAKYAVMVALSGTTAGALNFAQKNGLLIWDGMYLTKLATAFDTRNPIANLPPKSGFPS